MVVVEVEDAFLCSNCGLVHSSGHVELGACIAIGDMAGEDGVVEDSEVGLVEHNSWRD